MTAHVKGGDPLREEDGRERIAGIQRARIVCAMVAVVFERGVGGATVARVVARSGVSRRTFYEHFEDREDCFLAAFDHAVRRIAAVVVPAYTQQPKWHERVRAGLRALLELLDRERDVGRLVILETLGAGPVILQRRQRVLAQIVAAIDEGRDVSRASAGPPPLTAEGSVGGALSLIHARMAEDASAPLVELLNPLVSMIVLPYLGVAAARRELGRRTPKATVPDARIASEPLRELGMRLTYRTMRVLLTIGDRPGASNREVGDASGIRDQGQVSKLLARLEQLGLVSNSAGPHAKGEPNSWTLTERGADVQAAISPTSVTPAMHVTPALSHGRASARPSR